MRLTLRPFAAALLLAGAAACSDSTGPNVPLDPVALQADLQVANSAASSPATVSLAILGPQIGFALQTDGGALGIAGLPAALMKDPHALATRADLRAMAVEGGLTAAAIPAAALGKTFEYDVELGRYAAGARLGAPANGVRFVLYAIDPIYDEVAVPLVETGYVDLTRTVVNQVATARVQVHAGGANAVKVLDYSASVRGSAISPEIIVTGFARNAADSLTFTLTSGFSLANETIDIDWRTAVPTRGLATRVEQSIGGGGESPTLELFGLITSPNGRVSLEGTVDLFSGGTLTVKVNGQTFALMELHGVEGEPTVTNPQGQPLTQSETQMLLQIFEWFGQAFQWYAGLLGPVDALLDLSF